jgi:hypothetical protein
LVNFGSLSHRYMYDLSFLNFFTYCNINTAHSPYPRSLDSALT